METERRSETARRPRDRVSPYLLWFGVGGGTAAWAVHLLVAWSVMELACIAPTDGPWVDQRGGSPGVVAWSLVVAGTALPWLVAVAAFVACLVLRRRQRRLDAEDALDPIASGRVGFLLVLGLFLDLLSLAAITGGIVAMLTLEACG